MSQKNELPMPNSGTPAALTAFLIWGLLPIYWKSLDVVPSLELLCHRIIWSLGFVFLVLLLTKRLGEFRAAFTNPKTVLGLLLSSALVSGNWFTYIWAVNNNHVVESSLGYYINPLVNVLLGFIFFKDKLRPAQWTAVALATIGVVALVWGHGRLPWIALVLAFTFAFYGLVRKKVVIGAMPGLMFETMLSSVPALIYLGYLYSNEQMSLGAHGFAIDALLIGAGAITAIPLVLFAFGARRLSMATLGILQYIAPTLQFSLGVFLYGEPFTRTHAITFSFIWAGVILYSVEGFLFYRKAAKAVG